MGFREVQDVQAHKRAMQQVFGSRAVVATDAMMQREAEYRGLKPVHFAWGLKAAAQEIIGTDRGELDQLQGQACNAFPKSRLDEAQRRVLGLLKRLAQRANVSREVCPYTLPPGIVSQALGNRIALDVSLLGDAHKAIAAWLHEAAHAEYGAEADAVAQMAARVIVSYAAR